MNRPDATSHLRRWRTPAFIALGAWLVIGLLFIGQAMHADSFDLREAIKLSVSRTAIWLIFAPLAVTLGFGFPLERGRLPRNLAIHLAASLLLMVVAHRMLFSHANTPSRKATHEVPATTTQSLHENRNAQHPRGGAMMHIAFAHLALNLLFYGIIVSSCQAVVWSRRAQERERRALTAEARLVEARLVALQMRLNPHFLFNALNGVSTSQHLFTLTRAPLTRCSAT